MPAPPISDYMRAHMFDNWPEKLLQSMADDDDKTVPELKEHLLEYAALHDFDTLDGFLDYYGNNISVCQLDGAPADCNTLSAEPQTPTMTSPMSQNSDDCESVFDLGASAFTTPSSPYTPAKLRITENGSPIKRGNTEYIQLHHADGASSDLTETCDFEGSATDAAGQPIARMFDPEKSLKYGALPMEALLHYNSHKKVMHLGGVDPSTGGLHSDPRTLVISIQGVVYEDEEGQAGAAVFFHPLSPWNTVTCVEKTKENAKLEALYIALNMISITAANDPNLKAVRIMCTGREFCLANTTGDYSLADQQAVGKWLWGADKTMLSEVDELWTDITKGANGHRAVDVRLWCVPDEEIRPMTEVATAYIYARQGRDWYAENGKTRDRFDEVYWPNARAYRKDYPLAAPRYVVDQGPQAVLKWKAEVKARAQQSVIHKNVAVDGCRQLNDQLRAYGGLLSTEKFLEAYAMATRFMSEDPEKHIDAFVAGQRAIKESNQLQGLQVTNGGNGVVEGGETGGEDEKLVQQVLEMDWEMDWE